jgi:phosphate transport system permease protein
VSVTFTPPPKRDRGAATAPRPRPIPRAKVRPRRFSAIDYGLLLGSAIAAISLVWVFYYRVVPLTSRPGYWALVYVVFLTMYFVLTRQLYGRLEAKDRVMTVVIATGAMALVVPLCWILGYVISKGIKGLKFEFFTQTLENTGPLDPGGGALHAIVGTLQQVAIAVVIAVPLAVTTAIFLNEIGGRLARPVRFIVDAMSGVPSIVAGLFIYAGLILRFGSDFSGFFAALALSILMLPTVTRTTEEVLRLVPGGLRESSLALGSSEWRTALRVVLPTARAGIVTAVILGMARAIGETAPLLLTSGNSSFMNANPFSGPQSSLPIFVYRLAFRPGPEDVARAATGSLVLVLLVLVLFTLARVIGTQKVGKKKRRLRRRRTSEPTTGDELVPDAGMPDIYSLPIVPGIWDAGPLDTNRPGDDE